MARKNYPRNWSKVAHTIRRLAGERCEWCQRSQGEFHPCGLPVKMSVHHVGAPYADGKPGNPHDKHDLRRENLLALCDVCHFHADLPYHQEQNRREHLRQKGRLALVPYGMYL